MQSALSSTVTKENLFILEFSYIRKMDPTDLHKIKGPQDYHKFYHTSPEDLVWVDGKGNPISLSHTLGAHVEAIDLTNLWNSIQTRSKVHKLNI